MDEKKQQLFRQSSLDRISSPEDLNDYVRVANPGVWMIMGAIIVFLVGLCVWAVVGEMKTTVNAVGIKENGNVIFYANEMKMMEIKPGMQIVCDDGAKCTVKSVDEETFPATAVLSEYAQHLGEFDKGDWVCVVRAEGDGPEDGIGKASITVTRVSPISFILN